MLDKQQHEYYLKRILRDIAKDPALRVQLALKGGTCLYLFYNLPRFSIDLDFNLITESDLDTERMNAVLGKYLDLEKGRFKEGKAGWLWEASYKNGQRKFQIDISKKQYPDEYIVKQFYGLSVTTMVPEYMFAHKLVAITEREKLQNRDLFDSWFMFDNQFPVSEKIIRMRTNQSLVEYLRFLVEFIDNNLKNTNVLHGLGVLLDNKQKNWVKRSLISELVYQIQLKIDSLV